MMSLDVTILDELGFPADEVRIAANSHWELMQQVDALALPQLARMRDYYEDVDYTLPATILLQNETDTLVAQCSGKPELCSLIEQIQSLVHHAVREHKSIVALAD